MKFFALFKIFLLPFSFVLCICKVFWQTYKWCVKTIHVHSYTHISIDLYNNMSSLNFPKKNKIKCSIFSFTLLLDTDECARQFLHVSITFGNTHEWCDILMFVLSLYDLKREKTFFYDSEINENFLKWFRF